MRLFGRSSYWRNVSPTGAVRDFFAVWRDNPYRWRVLAVSMALTGVMLWGFIPKSERAPLEQPKITYITTFDPNRTMAEIIASNIANQKLKERLEAERAARVERSKQAARALARASGFDPDELERQYGDKPAEDAAKPQSGGTIDHKN